MLKYLKLCHSFYHKLRSIIIVFKVFALYKQKIYVFVVNKNLTKLK